MKVDIKNELDSTQKTISFSGLTVKELLDHLQINEEMVLVVREDEVLTADDTLQENDKIELLSVISGG